MMAEVGRYSNGVGMKRVLLGVAGSFLVFSPVSADIFGKSTAEKEHDTISNAIKAISVRESRIIENLIAESFRVDSYAKKYNKEALGSFRSLVDERIKKLMHLYFESRPMPVEKRKELLELYGNLRAALELDSKFLDEKIKSIFANPFTKKEKRFAYDLYRELLRKVQEAAKHIEPEIKQLILAKQKA